MLTETDRLFFQQISNLVHGDTVSFDDVLTRKVELFNIELADTQLVEDPQIPPLVRVIVPNTTMMKVKMMKRRRRNMRRMIMMRMMRTILKKFDPNDLPLCQNMHCI